MKLPVKETVMTACCVAILCGLGTWQIQRLHWKDGIIAELEQLYSRPLQQDLIEVLGEVESGDDDFGYGTLHSHFMKDKAILLGPRMQDGRSGYHLLIPIVVEGDKALIVNTGWVSDLWKDTLEERLGTLPADVTVRGLIRRPDWSSFTSHNSPENDLWFRADTKEIAEAKGLNKDNMYEVILYADLISPDLNDVEAHEEKWLPRNKHLQYALFWYALGIVMSLIYAFYVRGKSKPQVQE